MIEATTPGPWAVDNTRPSTWGISNTKTGRRKAIGPAGRYGKGRSIVNYYDRAMNEANRRNAELAAKTPQTTSIGA